MARIYMVRHGQAEAGFGGAMDPGLNALGREQAEAVAQTLAPRGPLAILSSSLRRAQETAAPLAALWRVDPVIEDAVAEIPSPKGGTLEERVTSLRNLLGGSWRGVSRDLALWLEHCIGTVAPVSRDTVIF